jgi:hypothetical protein
MTRKDKTAELGEHEARVFLPILCRCVLVFFVCLISRTHHNIICSITRSAISHWWNRQCMARVKQQKKFTQESLWREDSLSTLWLHSTRIVSFSFLFIWFCVYTFFDVIVGLTVSSHGRGNRREIVKVRGIKGENEGRKDLFSSIEEHVLNVSLNFIGFETLFQEWEIDIEWMEGMTNSGRIRKGRRKLNLSLDSVSLLKWLKRKWIRATAVSFFKVGVEEKLPMTRMLKTRALVSVLTNFSFTSERQTFFYDQYQSQKTFSNLPWLESVSKTRI